MGNCRSDASGTDGKKNGNRKVTLALFGLDNAGKTVTAKGFLGEEVETPTPTIGFSSVDFHHGRHDITLFDLGGGRNIRGIWRNYFAEIHGAIFVVDASAPTRLDECRKTLADVIGDDMIQGKPLLVLANKQDVNGAMDEMDICDRLQLEDLVNAHKTPCRVEPCSAALRRNQKMDQSIGEGFSWLLELVDEKWNALDERVRRDVGRKEAKERQERADRAERVRRSRELREKEEKENGRLKGEGESDREEVGDAGNPFKPIKHQLDTSQKREAEKKKSRGKQENHRHVSLESHLDSKRLESTTWRPSAKSKPSSDREEDITERRPAKSNHRSDSDEDTTRSRSNRRSDLDNDDVDQLRPSTRSRFVLDRERSSRSKHSRSDDETDGPRPKSTSDRRTDFDDERMEVRRMRNWNEPLKPIPPTRITGVRNGSDDSVTEEDEDRSGSSVFPSRTSRTRIITPPVPLLRATDAEGHRKWNGQSTALNLALNNDKKKKKKARFNQTEPTLDSPEPQSSWRNTYPASPTSDLFHSSSTYPAKEPGRMSRTPLLQRLVESKAIEESSRSRRTKSSDDDEDDDEDRPRTYARDSLSLRRPTSSVHSARKPNSQNYKYNDVSEDDDDDIIV